MDTRGLEYLQQSRAEKRREEKGRRGEERMISWHNIVAKSTSSRSHNGRYREE